MYHVVFRTINNIEGGRTPTTARVTSRRVDSSPTGPSGLAGSCA